MRTYLVCIQYILVSNQDGTGENLSGLYPIYILGSNPDGTGETLSGLYPIYPRC